MSVGPQGARSRRGFGPAGLVRVGDRDDGDILPPVEDQIKAMPVVAVPGVANNRRAEFLSGGPDDTAACEGSATAAAKPKERCKN